MVRIRGDSFAEVSTGGSQYGLINSNFDVVLEPIYKTITITEEFVVVKTQDGKLGIDRLPDVLPKTITPNPLPTFTKSPNNDNSGNASSGGGSDTPTPIPIPTTLPGSYPTSTVSTGWQNPFVDVKTNDWFYNDVKYAVENGLFNGISDTEFGPNMPMTRAMVITVLARYAGLNTSVGTGNGLSGDGRAWWAAAVEWGISNGITDDSDLEGNVTREQLATLLWRYIDEPESEGDLSKFSDKGNISEYAIPAMQWAVENGLISGYPDNTLRPQGTVTRAEVAAIIRRFVN